jgi:hypothetical protein
MKGLPLSFLTKLIRFVQFCVFFDPAFEAITRYIEMGSNPKLRISFRSKTPYMFGCSVWW